MAPTSKEDLAKERASRLGGYDDNLGFALVQAKESRGTPTYFFFLAESLLTMMIGMGLYKSGVLQGRRSQRFYATLLIAAYGVGLGVNAAEITYRLDNDFVRSPILFTTYELGRVPVTLGHVALINLLLGHSVVRRVLSLFAAPGRLALSCYVMQTLICCWLLFPGFGLGLYGKFGQFELALIAAGIALAQLGACHLWLRHFNTGPMEALLRNLYRGFRTPPASTEAARAEAL